ncbi:DeoR faimly transcriptional regulator [Caloranaerobacter sp. TR13]|uniref:DeoR/GlpR family DNA-binding transcription regulator n=1 Tax=Caloranaerobacter sp. TR13 TaxID=1302151 RepID=UPI0006D3AB03|nr:DeoR/GlpR family DNA-binding transcription regulator [Caloranaerobacter sp. TR13]KPU26581.1 DeoR faimly transcriptional regulator [Caloranaerobacter sp. TR13]
MFAEERKIRIAEMINRGESVKVSQLAKMFGVSESTIRRDLNELDSSGIIVRTHGGAVRPDINKFEASFLQKQDEHSREKELIGKLAASIIKDGDTIILDSGTTTQYIARFITAKDVTVITNSIPLSYELSNRDDIEVITTGGVIRPTTKATVGPITERTIREFRVDKVFIGANGISLTSGITTPKLSEANVKRVMMSVANKVYIVADESKFDKVFFSVICDIKDVDYIITNKKLSEDQMKSYEKLGVEIITDIKRGK